MLLAEAFKHIINDFFALIFVITTVSPKSAVIEICYQLQHFLIADNRHGTAVPPAEVGIIYVCGFAGAYKHIKISYIVIFFEYLKMHTIC